MIEITYIINNTSETIVDGYILLIKQFGLCYSLKVQAIMKKKEEDALIQFKTVYLKYLQSKHFWGVSPPFVSDQIHIYI